MIVTSNKSTHFILLVLRRIKGTPDTFILIVKINTKITAED